MNYKLRWETCDTGNIEFTDLADGDTVMLFNQLTNYLAKHCDANGLQTATLAVKNYVPEVRRIFIAQFIKRFWLVETRDANHVPTGATLMYVRKTKKE